MQLTPDLILGSLIGLFTSFLWAISTNVYKSQSSEATPLAISSLKMWAAMAFMSVILFIPFRTTHFYMPFDSLIFLILSVTIGLVVGDLVYLISQERIGVSYAFPIANIYPISTYIIAVFLVAEEVILSRFLGVLIAVIGITIISREQATRKKEEGQLKADILGLSLAFLAAICWALGSVLLQMGVEGVDPIDANFVRMLFGGAIFIPLFLGAVQKGMPIPSKRATKIVMAAGFLGMTMGSLLYTYTVKLIGASIAALLGSTSPLFALPISILILKEKFNRRSILGVILTVVGVMLVILAI
ncbi:DMT family transporter [Candidatus Thorarchaeota archaeon]|nr:MAG: DMT family transporter [Candidatus Thorarchaeota archaeon]